jgi:hypothetical protein
MRQTDGNCFAIACILNQYEGIGILRLITFDSRKYIVPEQNDDTYNGEFLAMPETEAMVPLPGGRESSGSDTM